MPPDVFWHTPDPDCKQHAFLRLHRYSMCSRGCFGHWMAETPNVDRCLGCRTRLRRDKGVKAPVRR